MSKPTTARLNNRIVTFLPPADMKRFRELAYQSNLCASELARQALRKVLLNSTPADRRYKS
jgi:hypothetical protein